MLWGALGAQPVPVVGRLVLLWVGCVCVCGPTVDDELSVLLLRVLHGVKCLLGDAVQVHVPPVFQHLKGDVGVVDHGPRRLPTNAHTALSTLAPS